MRTPRPLEDRHDHHRSRHPAGCGTAEGVLVTWFVHDGEAVRAGQLLAEVQVDKVTVEVTAPHAGVVHLLVPEEAAVTQGMPIVRVE